MLRRSFLADGSRRENDAEHMWHVALAGLLLAEHAEEPVDRARLVEMLLVHDLVEIHAGDTFVYDDPGDKAEREARAADRLFALLPADQGGRLRALWEEFEERRSPEARMAAAIDRILPLLLNRASGGRTWQEAGVHAERVRSVNSHLGEGSAALQEAAYEVIRTAVEAGLLAPGPDEGHPAPAAPGEIHR